MKKITILVIFIVTIVLTLPCFQNSEITKEVF